MWIEIFRTGSHTDSSGRTETYSEDTLDQISEIYNSKISESNSNEAPLVKGHPSTDEPAYGWIERLARRGQSLMAKLKDVAPELINEVSKGMFKKVSSAFYPDLMLRHVGLLGAVPPAVKDLRTVSFAGGEFNEIEVETVGINDVEDVLEEEGNPLNPPLKKEAETQTELDELIEKLNIENEKLKRAIEDMERENRKKEFSEYVNSLIDNPDGSLIKPSQQDSLIELLEFASELDEHRVEFNEADSLVNKVKVFVSGFEPVVQFKEFAVRRNDVRPKPEIDFHSKNVSPERLNLHEKAKQIQSENPDISYEEAVAQVQKELQLIHN